VSAQPATVERGVPRMEWSAFLDWLSWRQGEHVTLIGPTGQGKTTLAIELLPVRKWVVMFATKPKDRTLDGLRREGWYVTAEWPAPALERRVILWPPAAKLDSRRDQVAAFGEALEAIYRTGAWCIYADELAYLTDELRLEPELRMMWQQGRSLGISLVAGFQRPANVPLLAYSQATHLFLWRTNDGRDLKRLQEVSGVVDLRTMLATVQSLDRHEALYVNTRTGAMAATTAPAP